MMILLMTASTFITQRQLMVKNMPTGVDNPMAQQQKILLYVFPVMFAVFGINFPIGVLIYWLTTNVWTMGQQFWVIRRNPTPGSEAWDDLQKRKAAKARDRGEPVPVPDVPEAPAVVRSQPKRQSKSQRKGGPRTGSAGSGSASSAPETPPTDSAGTTGEEAS